MKLQRLSPEEFDRIVAAKPRMQEQTRNMARAVLVDGRTQGNVAAEYDMSQQRVQLAVASIERTYMATAGVGGGVVRVSFELPERLALEFGALLDALKGCPDVALANEAVDRAITGIRGATRQLK
jgi:hypothetical protein